MTIGSIAGSLVAIWGAITLSDELVMTEFEHHEDLVEHRALMHPMAEQAIQGLQKWNKCSFLDRKLETIQERIWRAEDKGQDERVRELEADREALLRTFNDLGCASILAP